MSILDLPLSWQEQFVCITPYRHDDDDEVVKSQQHSSSSTSSAKPGSSLADKLNASCRSLSSLLWYRRPCRGFFGPNTTERSKQTLQFALERASHFHLHWRNQDTCLKSDIHQIDHQVKQELHGPAALYKLLKETSNLMNGPLSTVKSITIEGCLLRDCLIPSVLMELCPTIRHYSLLNCMLVFSQQQQQEQEQQQQHLVQNIHLDTLHLQVQVGGPCAQLIHHITSLGSVKEIKLSLSNNWNAIDGFMDPNFHYLSRINTQLKHLTLHEGGYSDSLLPDMSQFINLQGFVAPYMTLHIKDFSKLLSLPHLHEIHAAELTGHVNASQDDLAHVHDAGLRSQLKKLHFPCAQCDTHVMQVLKKIASLQHLEVWKVCNIYEPVLEVDFNDVHIKARMLHSGCLGDLPLLAIDVLDVQQVLLPLPSEIAAGLQLHELSHMVSGATATPGWRFRDDIKLMLQVPADNAPDHPHNIVFDTRLVTTVLPLFSGRTKHLEVVYEPNFTVTETEANSMCSILAPTPIQGLESCALDLCSVQWTPQTLHHVLTHLPSYITTIKVACACGQDPFSTRTMISTLRKLQQLFTHPQPPLKMQQCFIKEQLVDMCCDVTRPLHVEVQLTKFMGWPDTWCGDVMAAVHIRTGHCNVKISSAY